MARVTLLTGTIDVQSFGKIEKFAIFLCVVLTWNDPQVIIELNCVPYEYNYVHVLFLCDIIDQTFNFTSYLHFLIPMYILNFLV